MAGGIVLKGLSWFLRIIEFCCAIIIMGIYSYFVSALRSRALYVPEYVRAVVGISAAAVIYTLLALLLVCFLGGITIFSTMGMVLDLAFFAAFIYLAWATRSGRSCSDIVNTPVGTGQVGVTVVVVNPNTNGDGIQLPSLITACRLNKACFAVAIIGCIFFFFSIFVEYMLIRHRKRETTSSTYNNRNTTGTRTRGGMFGRRNRNSRTARDTEFLAAEKAHHHNGAVADRPSYATDATAVGAGAEAGRYSNVGNTRDGVVGNGPLNNGGLAGNRDGMVGNGNGYQTTTTTHVPHHTGPHVPGTGNAGYGNNGYAGQPETAEEYYPTRSSRV